MFKETLYIPKIFNSEIKTPDIHTSNTTEINNLNVDKISKLITPEKLKQNLPISNKILKFVKETRDEIKDILNGDL